MEKSGEHSIYADLVEKIVQIGSTQIGTVQLRHISYLHVSLALSSDNSAMSTDNVTLHSDNAAPAKVRSGDEDQDNARLFRKATVSVIHEATLQDLLHCSNDALLTILWERNILLRERYS